MDAEAVKSPRISAAEKRTQQIELLNNLAAHSNDSFNITKREYFTSRTNVGLAKLKMELATRILKEQKEKMLIKEAEYIKEMNKNSNIRAKINRLLAVDEVKNRTFAQKQNDSVQKRHDKRGGKHFDISKLNLLPLEVVCYIGEFLTYDVRIQYLESLYKPLSIFNKLRINVKMFFIELALLQKKYFSHLSEKQKEEYNTKIHLACGKTINDEIYSLVHNAKQVNPEGAFRLIKAMCILFKKNKKYNANWHAFYAIRTRAELERRQAGN